MKERKKGTMNQFAGNLSKDVNEVSNLSQEKASDEVYVTHTFTCDALFTIYCC